MEALRWILLGIGLLILLGVFLHTRGVFRGAVSAIQGLRRKPGKESVTRTEPVVDGTTGVASEPVAQPERENNKVVAVRLVPEPGAEFTGEELVMALRDQGLRHGRHGVFHRLEDGEEGEGRFCVASLVEPGSFDLKKLKDSRYPGVSFFMLLPASVDGVLVFDDMLTVAHALAQDLEGRLLDESGNRLSIQRERYLREEVIEFERIRRGAASSQ